MSESMYAGIGEEQLNRMATLQAYSLDELKIVTNSMWRQVYGHDVIYDNPIKPDYEDGTWN